MNILLTKDLANVIIDIDKLENSEGQFIDYEEWDALVLKAEQVTNENA